jgi:hypothetical protein
MKDVWAIILTVFVGWLVIICMNHPMTFVASWTQFITNWMNWYNGVQTQAINFYNNKKVSLNNFWAAAVAIVAHIVDISLDPNRPVVWIVILAGLFSVPLAFVLNEMVQKAAQAVKWWIASAFIILVIIASVHFMWDNMVAFVQVLQPHFTNIYNGTGAAFLGAYHWCVGASNWTIGMFFGLLNGFGTALLGAYHWCVGASDWIGTAFLGAYNAIINAWNYFTGGGGGPGIPPAGQGGPGNPPAMGSPPIAMCTRRRNH